ncbi:MAG: aspartate--tRNA(Asn) ligase [Candidatus Diapherotrites archaeon]|nr:aspartate--tRNA(Asn) ligase [Candidatus Diapherotrites archaeon]MDZ4256885.1 aspartate--tRNA(Asn) ligase [archaeon]
MIRTHTCGELRGADAGKDVILEGWVDTFRETGKISFILLRDRTGITQVFVNKTLTEAHASTLKPETVIRIRGKVNQRPDNQIRAEEKTGAIEVEATAIEILNPSDAPLPIEMRADSTTHLDKRLDYRFLDLRRKNVQAIFRIRSQVSAVTHTFFIEEGFLNIQTPKLTASGVESGAEEFKLDYFGKTASLAQSPQIYKQMFVVSGLEKVYAIEPIFRAEKSHTTRHLTEFTGIDFEMGFVSELEDVMKVVEKYLQTLLTRIQNECAEELETLGVMIDIPPKIPRLSLQDARQILSEKGKTIPEDDDLDAEGERLIGEYVKETWGNDFVFMLDYPWKKRPFYHMRPPDDPKRTLSFDVIYKGVEIGTGALREHRLPILDAQAKEKGIPLDQMTFYRDLFKYGAPPHGGIGLGLDRIIKQMLNLTNVKEAILLPRDPERLTP